MITISGGTPVVIIENGVERELMYNLPDDGGIVPTGSQTFTENGTYDVTEIAEAIVNVGGGGGSIGTLLATQPLGHIEVTSTSSVDLNKSVVVEGVNDYDLLIVKTTLDDYTTLSGNHATIALADLGGTATISTKNKITIANMKQYLHSSSHKTNVVSNQSTTPYGIYPNTAVVSDDVATLGMYGRYSSEYSDTINGDYTTRVYGIKLFDGYY